MATNILKPTSPSEENDILKPISSSEDTTINNIVTTEPVTLPSTSTNQLETQAIQTEQVERQAEFESIKKDLRTKLERNFGKVPTNIDSLALQELKSRQSMRDNEAATKLVEAVKLEEQTRVQDEQAISSYLSEQQDAKDAGVIIAKNPEIESIIKLRNQQKADAAQQEEINSVKAEQERIKIEQANASLASKGILNPTEQQLKSQLNQNNAEEAQIQEQTKRQIVSANTIDVLQRQFNKKIEEKQAEIEKGMTELRTMKPVDYWDSKSTGQKILGGVALLLGAIGAAGTGGINHAAGIIQKDMEAYAEQNARNQADKFKLLNEQQQMIDKYLSQLDRATNNEVKKAQIQKARAAVHIEYNKTLGERQQLLQEDMMFELLGKGSKTVDRAHIEKLSAQFPKLKIRERMIDLGPEHGVVFTTSERDANVLKKDVLPEGMDALRGIKRLQELTDEIGFLDKVNPFSKEVAEADTLQKSVVGALRLKLFGPGVMTDDERRVAMQIIGDPTKITSFDENVKARLQVVELKMQQGIRDQLRSSGVNLAPNVNEQNINLIQSKSPNMKRPEIINSLIKTGRWKKDVPLI
jgi:hypothetical protein